MNKYEKKVAQIEKKELKKHYEVWAFPQSDLGVAVLGEAGFYSDYKQYYDDPLETEKERIETAKDIARYNLAKRFDRFSHRFVSTKQYSIPLFSNVPGYNPDLKEGHDYALQVNEIPVGPKQKGLSFDDIKTLAKKGEKDAKAEVSV